MSDTKENPTSYARSAQISGIAGISVTTLIPSMGAGLVTWKAFNPAGPVRLRGAYFDGATRALGPAFDISDAWASPTKTGDYSKVAFFHDASGFNFFVPWVAEGG